MLQTGIGDEVALGSLHTRLEFAMAMVGNRPEAGVAERLEGESVSGVAFGRYTNRDTGTTEYAAMSLAKTSVGMAEILVTHCDTEESAAALIQAAMSPYV